MKQLYYTHIYPHLIQNISIWGTHDNKKKYIQPLIKIHKKIIRIIAKTHYRAHTKPLLDQLQLLDITHLYTLRVCIENHPFIYPKKNLNRPLHNNTFTPISTIHSYKTRHSTKSNLFVHHKDPYLTKIFANQWKSIPKEITDEKSINIFKKTLMTYLLKHQQL